jgi:hypothetical protein
MLYETARHLRIKAYSVVFGIRQKIIFLLWYIRSKKIFKQLIKIIYYLIIDLHAHAG